MFICTACGLEGEASKEAHLCTGCHSSIMSRYSNKRQANEDWLVICEQAGLEMWERQPGETDLEWATWVAYRAYYPGKQPTQKALAVKNGFVPSVVNSMKRRWDYGVRMRAWALYIDKTIQATRYNEILSMNKEQVSMSQRLNKKLSVAIDRVDENNLTPNELVRLMSMATELERKAKIDNVTTGKLLSESTGVVDTISKGSDETKIKKDDMAEILGILSHAGLLNSGGAVKTTTTKVTELVNEPIEVIK